MRLHTFSRGSRSVNPRAVAIERNQREIVFYLAVMPYRICHAVEYKIAVIHLHDQNGMEHLPTFILQQDEMEIRRLETEHLEELHFRNREILAVTGANHESLIQVRPMIRHTVNLLIRSVSHQIVYPRIHQTDLRYGILAIGLFE